MKSEHISVEIFRDTDRREVAVDAAEVGIDQLSGVACGIKIMRATGLLKIAEPEAEVVNADKINWSNKFEADLNVVLTDRQIYSAGNVLLGVTHMAPGVGSAKVAIVNVLSTPQPELTVAHEGGHLLNAKSSGEKWDGDAHCTDPTCLMYISSEIDIVEERVRQTGLHAWLERQGFREAEYELVHRPKAQTFCDECALEINKKSFFLQRAKLGKVVLNEWL